MKRSFVTFVLVALIALSATAQEETSKKKTSHKPILASSLKLEFIKIENENRLGAIANMLERLHGRQIRVQDQSGAIRFVRNIDIYGESIVVHEVPEYIPRIKTTISRLDIPVRPQPVSTKSGLVTFKYKPNFISVYDARDALAPFKRMIRVSKLGASNPQQAANYTIVDSSGVVIIRDTKDQVMKMADILERIDAPKAQFMVSCMLIQSTKDGNDERAAKMIPSELKTMSPHKNFKTVASGVVRVAAGSGQTVRLSMTGKKNLQAKLSFNPSSFDSKSGSLGLSNVAVEYTAYDDVGRKVRQSFSTSTTIKFGDYVVIGAFGDNPVFAVLNLVQLK